MDFGRENEIDHGREKNETAESPIPTHIEIVTNDEKKKVRERESLCIFSEKIRNHIPVNQEYEDKKYEKF